MSTRAFRTLTLSSCLVFAPVLTAGPAAGQPAEDFDVLEAARKMRWAMELGNEGPDTDENSAELLAVARDTKQPAGVRGSAIRAFGAMAGRRVRGHSRDFCTQHPA
jgi:hypothetical protein